MSRFFAQMVVQAAKVMSESFSAAYRLALQNTRAGGGPAVVKPSAGYKMKADEALRILNIEKSNLNRRVLNEQYNKFFELNDPDKGGSFYLRSKIYRAKEALDRELDESAPRRKI